MRSFLFVFVLAMFFSCKAKNVKNCYPDQPVTKTVIMVADTSILHKMFVPDEDTIRTWQVFNGIGFVKPDGTPVHKPLKQLTLSESQQQEFLKILRPVPPQNDGYMTSCIPYYRHVVLFYDRADSLIAQMHICFGCEQVQFRPEARCLNFFDNHRLPEIEKFFKANGIPVFDF